ncbi:hypothetical protein HHI36_022948 [Cryptolaemus montrouzieri]|uniref:Dynamin-type G domain-containing protein n=1 Tax=Cryptolaemus montrouzieri TaxID=559131 RepID=A0ABD2PEU5_9CUCU
MEVCKRSSWLLPLLGVILLAEALQGVQGEVEIEGPSENECRPYIEKALRQLENTGAGNADVGQSTEEASRLDPSSIDENQSDEQRSSETSETETETQESREKEAAIDNESEQQEETEAKTDDASTESNEDKSTEKQESLESKEEEPKDVESSDTPDSSSTEHIEDQSKEAADPTAVSAEGTPDTASTETAADDSKSEQSQEQVEAASLEENVEESIQETTSETIELVQDSTETTQEPSDEGNDDSIEQAAEPSETENDTSKQAASIESEQEDTPKDQSDEDSTSKDQPLSTETKEDEKTEDTSKESKETVTENRTEEQQETSSETHEAKDGSSEEVQAEDVPLNEQEEVQQETDDDVSRHKRTVEESAENKSEEDEINVQKIDNDSIESTETKEETPDKESKEDDNDEGDKIGAAKESNENETVQEENTPEGTPTEKEDEEVIDDSKSNESETAADKSLESVENEDKEEIKDSSETDTESKGESAEDAPEEELIIETDIPKDLRSRDHVEQLLKLDREATKTEEIVDRISEITLRELKRLYENAIKPLETLYKYRDLSNRHYGDAEIFSKPLILFMGPWSGGKSSIINYLLNVEYNDTALRTGAEPSPAYFNLLMHGEEEEVLDGTQLAADYTFSGLQKFGQGLEERLRGVKLQSKLLEKVNIVEIPGILEVRKQVSRVFPFNDACQWFIDRADIIFLVYDPSKLDVGPETEAILDQLKGREYQTRIVLNKADQVKPEELMRVQGALIWNISPLMSSPQPPVMYTTSLWSRPYEQWAPVRLLQAQERAFLRDLRSAIDRRIENKIASARRFAVRVRNHAKMVDCYLTTYYNHKSIFGNRKQVSDAIIEHPQDYHIYEGLSTLTNISRYDLPDPDVYKDFFRLNPLYEFQQLSATCTYFRGCPINKLDVAIAYDLPELVGKHKRFVEAALAENNQEKPQGS